MTVQRYTQILLFADITTLKTTSLEAHSQVLLIRSNNLRKSSLDKSAGQTTCNPNLKPVPSDNSCSSVSKNGVRIRSPGNDNVVLLDDGSVLDGHCVRPDGLHLDGHKYPPKKGSFLDGYLCLFRQSPSERTKVSVQDGSVIRTDKIII